MKSVNKYLEEKFDSLGKIQEGVEEMVRVVQGDAYTPQRFWHMQVIPKSKLEDAKREGWVVSRDQSGLEEKKLTQAEIEAQQDEDDDGVEKIERPKGSLRKGERFEEDAKDAWYLNQYKCSECGEEWENEDDSMMNDRCPKCNAETEPFKSTPIDDAIEGIEEKKMTQAEIEAQKASEEEDEDADGVEKIERPKGSLRKGERFGEQYETIQYGEKFLDKADKWLDQTFLGE